MEKYDIDVISLEDEKKRNLGQSRSTQLINVTVCLILFTTVGIRQALTCGFFMHVAHKEGEKGSYLTVKDNQVNGTLIHSLSDVDLLLGRRSSSFLRPRFTT